MTTITIRKHRKPRDVHAVWTPQQQAEKLTTLIQIHARHAVVTTSGSGCFYLLSEPYSNRAGERWWAHAQMIGASYQEAATTLNRLYAVALDPARGNTW
jgi:hypothetical protein